MNNNIKQISRRELNSITQYNIGRSFIHTQSQLNRKKNRILSCYWIRNPISFSRFSTFPFLSPILIHLIQFLFLYWILYLIYKIYIKLGGIIWPIFYRSYNMQIQKRNSSRNEMEKRKGRMKYQKQNIPTDSFKKGRWYFLSIFLLGLELEHIHKRSSYLDDNKIDCFQLVIADAQTKFVWN